MATCPSQSGDVYALVTAFEITSASVPEPGSAALLSLLGVGLLARRRRQVAG